MYLNTRQCNTKLDYASDVQDFIFPYDIVTRPVAESSVF